MKKLSIFLSWFYIIELLIILFCVPLSTIFLIIKLCTACSMSWLGCCFPLLVAIAITPFLVIAKILLDNKGGK